MQIIQNPSAAGGSLLDIFADNPIVIGGLLFLAAVPFILKFFGGLSFSLDLARHSSKNLSCPCPYSLKQSANCPQI